MKGDLKGPSPVLDPIMAMEAALLGLRPHNLYHHLRPTKGRGSRGESIRGVPKSYKGPRGMGGVA
jgi:hypothetical protein